MCWGGGGSSPPAGGTLYLSSKQEFSQDSAATWLKIAFLRGVSQKKNSQTWLQKDITLLTGKLTLLFRRRLTALSGGSCDVSQALGIVAGRSQRQPSGLEMQLQS